MTNDSRLTQSAGYVCEDCDWKWPLKSAPEGAECDNCGGELIAQEPTKCPNCKAIVEDESDHLYGENRFGANWRYVCTPSSTGAQIDSSEAQS